MKHSQSCTPVDPELLYQGLRHVVVHLAGKSGLQPEQPKTGNSALNEFKSLGFSSGSLAQQFRKVVRHVTINLAHYRPPNAAQAMLAGVDQRFGATELKSHTQKFVDDIKKYKNLRSIKLTGPFNDKTLAALACIHSLQQLDATAYYGSKITNDGLSHLAGLTKLQHLNLQGCDNITHDGLGHLAGLTKLQHLNLQGCRNITNDGLSHLAGLTKLQHLNLEECRKITNDGLSHLAGLTNLEHLDMSWCTNITNDGLGHLAGLTKLQHLNLQGCSKITNDGLGHLAGLTKLQYLNLEGCSKITNDGLSHLAGLTNLRTIV